MERPKRIRVRARQSLSALVVLSLLVTLTVPTVAQHDQHAGHDMPKPRARQPRKRKAQARPKPRPRRKRPARTSRQRPTVTPTPAAKPQDAHTGHQVTPTATPAPASPTVTATPQPHEQHTIPSPQPATSPTPRQTPDPAMDHTMHQTTQPQERSPIMRDDLPDGPVVRLEDLERTALERNPTLAQAEASVRASLGRRRQAGLWPNPVVGYAGEELNFRAPSERGEHGFFVEQTIPLGGKLGKAKRVFAREAEQAESIAQAQRQRVLNSVRMLYYDALGAQRMVELRIELANLSREAAEITKELFNVGQADRPDQLEIEIEAERAEIDLLRARNDREQVWRLLGAMVGNPELRPSRLEGRLEDVVQALDQEQILTTLLRDSPEVKAAQSSVERARAVLVRARAERIPDLFLRGGVGYNKERLEIDNRKAGAEGRIEAGITLPIFNRNQGGIAAAEAELAIAERELERLQLVLRTRLASGFREYRNASQMVEKYRTEVVPRARQAYEMYLSNFRQMAASYPQVLIAQRTLFQVEVEYARALLNLRQSITGLRGFLLTGGLDAVGRPGESEREGTEGFKLRSPNEATGDSDNR